jgi:DNA polymerase III delta subunit
LGLELAEGAVPFMVLGLLRSVVERTVAARDLPPALEALLRTDLALKTSGGDPRVLLERLVVELCATGKD